MVNRAPHARRIASVVRRTLSTLLACSATGLAAGSCAPPRFSSAPATGAPSGVASSGSLAANRRLVERYFEEAWNRGDVDALDELLGPDYVNHTPSVPNPPPGPAGLKPIVLAIRAAFPDLRYTIEDVIVTEDRVVARVTMTGTHEGPLFGLPPTGRHVRVTQINIERIERGRIVEHWRVTDELTLMRQLGAVP